MIHSRLDALRLASVFAAACIYWALASFWLRAAEPWDSPHFLPTYLGAIGLSALCGWFFRRAAWRWGVVILFGQLPVVIFNTGIGPLLPVGIGWTALAAIPAAIAAMGAAKTRVWAGR